MEKIFSKIKPDLLLHVIFRFEDFNEPRKDILEAHNFLQSSAVVANAGTSFRSHRHIEKVVNRSNEITQECQVVIRGSVECSLYDIDDTLLTEINIKSGDALYTLRGGHGFTILDDKTCLLEFKSSPYEGQVKDKIFINE
jgi:hypothetical protein